MNRLEGSVPGAGFSTIPVMRFSRPDWPSSATIPYWCAMPGGQGSTTMMLPPPVCSKAEMAWAVAVGVASMIMSGQQDRERLVADDLAGAPDGVAQALGLHLAHVADLAGGGQVRHQLVQDGGLLLGRQRGFQFDVVVEIVLHRALAAAGDQDEVLDAGGARLGQDVVDQRAVDHRQHLLGHRLGGGEHAGAEARHGQHGFADAFHAGSI